MLLLEYPELVREILFYLFSVDEVSCIFKTCKSFRKCFSQTHQLQFLKSLFYREKMKSSVHYLNKFFVNKEGLHHGYYCIITTANSIKVKEGFFKNGKEEGLWIFRDKFTIVAWGCYAGGKKVGVWRNVIYDDKQKI